MEPCRGHVTRLFEDLPSKKILGLGERYIGPEIRGELGLSVGRALEYVHEGFHGVINVAPLNCMPGTICNSLLSRMKTDHDNVPLLHIAYDGLTDTNEQTRLEAFTFQAGERLREELERGGETTRAHTR